LLSLKHLQHIHPIFDTILGRPQKETLLEQKATVLWMLGLSGSGKSTLAREIERQLHSKGYLTQLLDGDNLRTGINNNLGFSEADRQENIRRAAETAKLFLNCGIITICSFISPTRQSRDIARSIVGEPDFLEVYINCPIEECERRDVKGLYAKARRGEIKQFTGIDAPFEEPTSPFIEIRTDKQDLKDSTDQLLAAILPKITFQQR
jgi:adenylylsulfate kinase